MIESIFLITKGSDDPLVWYFFLIFLFVFGIVIGILILIYSKNPMNWEHKPMIDEYYLPGKLRQLSDSIKIMPVDYSDNSSMNEYIQLVFFEKIRSLYGISTRELLNMKLNNPNKLKEIIDDKEILDFILNFQKKEEKTKFRDYFKKDKLNVRKKYFDDLNNVLNKMEVWGE